MSFPAKPFNLEMPSNNCLSLCLIGTTRSGKSTLMMYLMKHYFKSHITTMFTMNPHADIYKKLSDKVTVTESYRPELIEECSEINKLSSNKYSFCWISDDYVDSKIKNCPTITRLLTIGRNCGQSSIFLFQDPTLLNSVGRNNTNVCIILRQQTAKRWEMVIKDMLAPYLPMGLSMKEMIDFCMKATEDHQFFVIDNLMNECYISKLSLEQVKESS